MKCKLLADMVEYLGHDTGAGWFALTWRRADALVKLKQPAKPTELRLFLGLCNAFRLLVPNLCRLFAAFTKCHQTSSRYKFAALIKRRVMQFSR